MKTLKKTEVPLHRGDEASVRGMPNYGSMRVWNVKWSHVSGWWLDLRDEDGGMWTVPYSEVVSA